jgi:pimeloyl-ACP methyl ester carboxylesterase
MIAASALFDPDSTRRPPYLGLVSEFRAFLSYNPPWLSPADLPDGGNLPVLVIPAFMTSDGFTARLRRFLLSCNFRPFGWRLGTNIGPTPRILARLSRRLADIADQHGPVSLIGISMGGVLARNLAYETPHLIRHVVTVASPFRLPTASPLAPLVRLCALGYSADIQPARLLTTLPVPSTIIYTPDDGIVAADSCWIDDPNAHIIALSGAHTTLPRNPAAWQAIVRNLAPARRIA